MTVQTTANLSNSVRTKYLKNYLEGAEEEMRYVQFATPVSSDSGEVIDGLNTVQIPFLSDIPIASTALSETADVNPVTVRDTTATISGTFLGNAHQWSQALDIRSFTNYTDKAAGAYKAVGRNMMQSVDFQALSAALAGTNVYTFVARASLDAGTSTHNLNRRALMQVQARLQTLGCPYFPRKEMGGATRWAAMGHVDAFYDLLNDADILPTGQYSKPEIVLNFEIGTLGLFKLVADAGAKVLGGAGIDHASVCAATLASAVNALATTFVASTTTNLTIGRYLTIGTEETATTYQTTNERVMVTSTTGTTVRIIGEGANGGFRWDHASGEAVRNADSVYPVVFGSPLSMARLVNKATGPNGETVGPKTTGLLDQFTSLGWKWAGGFGRWRENCLLRGEFSSSLDNIAGNISGAA